MKCPICPDATLLMTDRHGVEIDYCPNCRGVWLDRGELDKLLAVASGPAASVRRFADSGHHGEHQPRRKKSWLSEIFD